MDKKRYQVFISSTYVDLKEERQAVLRVLMQMDCIPSGMELFPAADEEQFEFIKKVIDDCDYYLLIIGGRYGSVTAEGISYTEKEFDYARSIGLQTLVFVHKSPEDISVKKSERGPELVKRLSDFRQKASAGRLHATWETPDQLAQQVVLSLSQTMKTHPAVGWIKANGAGSQELLAQMSQMYAENNELKAKLAALVRPQEAIANLAGLAETYAFKAKYQVVASISSSPITVTMSWGQIFAATAPFLLESPADAAVQYRLNASIASALNPPAFSVTIDEQSYQTIKVQLTALGLVDIRHLQTTTNTMALFWYLTAKGKELMIRMRAIRSGSASAPVPDPPGLTLVSGIRFD